METEVTVGLPFDVSLLVAGIIMAAVGAFFLSKGGAIIKLLSLIPLVGGIYVFLRSFEVISYELALFICTIVLTAAGAMIIDLKDKKDRKIGQSLIGIGVFVIGVLALIDTGLALLPEINLGGNLSAVFRSGWGILEDIMSRADNGLADVNQ